MTFLNFIEDDGIDLGDDDFLHSEEQEESTVSVQ